MRMKFIFRVMAAVAAWGLFFWWWWHVSRPSYMAGRTFELCAVSLLVTVAAIVAAASGWILHNLRLSRRGRRRVPRSVTARFERDFLGRILVLPSSETLAGAPVIVIRTENNRKVYEPEIRPGPTDEQLPALEMVLS